MMLRTKYSLLLAACLCCLIGTLPGQSALGVQIDSARISVGCGDFFGSPDPLWGVAINGEAYQYYPQNGPCFQGVPNQQYFVTASCPNDLPAEVEVCFHGLENDPFLPPPLSCEINPDCEATICQTFPLPPDGQPQSLTLDLPAAGDVTGTLFFTLALQSLNPPAPNDLICDAIDLGTLNFNSSVGSLSGPVYSNYCATDLNEPDPFDNVAAGVFLNDQGVWFRFETGPTTSEILLIDVLSDPLQTGDEFDAQVAAYRFPGGDCTATPIFLGANSDNDRFDVQLRLTCIEPNTVYHLLVDGGTFGNESIEGPFTIRVIDPGVQEGGDRRCDFEDLGVVPEGGFVQTDGFRSNFCADDFDDPFVAAFVSQHSVWFSFVAPSSGHVVIDALTDQLIQPIDAQLAIYSPFSGNCNGGLRHLQSQYVGGDPDESMEVSCLFGGQRYFVLVDGSGFQARGIFQLSVSDAGDITPVETIDTLICAGESVRVGNNLYTSSGNYIDTLPVQAGCNRIVFTNLTVAEPLTVTFEQTRIALGEGMADAEAELTVSGGIGTPTISWCDGQTGASAVGLIGGSACCVTIVDSIGCSLDTCFQIDFITGVAPIFRDTSVACFGDENGLITFSAANGLPPYQYEWRSEDGSRTGGGTIDSDFQEIRIPDLPAGNYAFTLSDSFLDTSFVIRVSEPPLLRANVAQRQDITCAGSCDGRLQINVSGGTPPYDLAWNDGTVGLIERLDLCPGAYGLTVTDANGCRAVLADTLVDPPVFTARAQVLQPVSCFGGSNGRIGVQIENGVGANYRWSNGATTASQSGLAAGFYRVTVTSDLLCEAVTEIELAQPAAPLEVAIETVNPISCGGASDGALRARISGPADQLQIQWNNGATTANLNDLPAGNYFLQVRNGLGCTAADSAILSEPPLIEASLSTRDITCLDPPESGSIFIDAVSGGLGDYRFSVDGDQFTSRPVINELSAGNYELIVQDRGGCERQFPVTIQAPPELTVELGPETIELQLGDSLQLTAQASSNAVRYQWDHDGALTGATATVAPQISSSYRVRVEDTETLCRAEAIVFVRVNKDRRVYIPNAFSPNMDGNNDYFFIYGDNDIVSIESLRIFDRSGQLIYQDTDLTPNDPLRSWDGTFNGRALSPGVYVYVAQIRFVDGLTEVFRGDVALVR